MFELLPRLEPCEWAGLAGRAGRPARLVVLRQGAPPRPPCPVPALREDIALIQTRLAEKLQAGREVTSELGTVQVLIDKTSQTVAYPFQF